VVSTIFNVYEDAVLLLIKYFTVSIYKLFTWVQLVFINVISISQKDTAFETKVPTAAVIEVGCKHFVTG
jgi:hypothetical protein